MPLKAPPPPPAPTWTGCYLGGNVGAALDHTYVHDETPPFGPIATLDDTNVAGGGQVGCDYQFAGNWVIGVQGMIDATGSRASTTSPVLAPLTLNGSVPWFATVTGRLGFVVAPNWLLYTKGGGAWTRDNSNLTIGGTVVDTANFNLNGWTAGGGAEWRVSPCVSLFVEYDYIGFNDKLVVSSGGGNLGVAQQQIQTVLVGLNLHMLPMH